MEKMILPVVAGPTASGKTRYAVQLAREMGRCPVAAGHDVIPGLTGNLCAEILSADSRRWQVLRIT